MGQDVTLTFVSMCQIQVVRTVYDIYNVEKRKSQLYVSLLEYQ